VTTVAVTGVGGAVGRRLVAALDEREDVERIVGLDVRAPAGLTSPKLAFRAGDVRDVALADLFAGVDVVVHLAAEHAPPRDEAARHATNVAGALAVARAAAAAGVRKLVHLSTALVYGAHPDNDLPLTEESPLRANPYFDEAEHAVEVEEWLWPWAASHPELSVTVLRPSTVAGPGAESALTRLLEAPRFPAIKGHKPPMQFTHVDDLAEALAHVIEHDLPGAYNVSSEGWLSFDEVTALVDRRLVELPEEVAFSSTERLWELGLGYAPPGQLHYLMHPWVLTVDKLLATGWRPRHSNRDALATLVAEHADWLRVPGLRLRRSMLRGGIAATGAALAALLILSRVWRHRATDTVDA
jgi:nucleoside-diphosphate-sugar epimerase